MKFIQKGLLVLALMISCLAVQAVETCITNLVIFAPGDCILNVITAPPSGWTRQANTITGTCLFADSCTNGPLFSVSLPPGAQCATNYNATVGQISWSCSATCGGETHSFLLQLPVNAYAMRFRLILDPNALCGVQLCIVDYMGCEGAPPED